MSNSGVALPYITGFFYDDQSLNFREQGFFVENHPSPSYLTATLAQQEQHLVTVDGPRKPNDLHTPSPIEQDRKAQVLRSTTIPSKGTMAKLQGQKAPAIQSKQSFQVAVPVGIEHHIEHSGKEGVKGDGRLEKPVGAPKSVSLGAAVVSEAPSGYILAVNYYEQQTIGSRNLLQLQCMAKHLNLAVVKPVMKSSFLKTPLDDEAQRTYLKFEDSFNLDEWVAYAEKAPYAPLVEWENFLTEAPRDVILVQFNHPSLSVIKSRKKVGPETQRAQKERYQTGCAEKWPSSSELAFIETEKFRIVRSVCFNFYHGDMVSLKEFDEHMFGGHAGANVTVIFDTWRGLGSSQRVLIEGVCASIYPIQEYIRPSQRLVRDAEAYIQTYLKGEPFVAIMGRLEMSLLTVHSKDFSVSSCLRNTVSELLKLKEAKHVHETFISIDIGKYGTKKWRSKMDKDMIDSLEGFFRSVYGSSMSVKDWETSFEKISSSTDAGYIALLQKVVVTRARCILFVGGGAFQRHALNLYRQLDTNRNNECLGIVKYCTSATKLTL